MDIQISLIPSDVYSIDTNIFIEIWGPPQGNIYSKERMPDLWKHIELLAEQGRIIASKEVYDELKEHASDELMQWLNAHKYIFSMSKEQIDAARTIINEVYALYKNGFKPEIKNAADPFVVAVAAVCGGRVLSLESRQQPHNPRDVGEPKIPTVCEHYKIPCYNLDEFLEVEGFSISLQRNA